MYNLQSFRFCFQDGKAVLEAEISIQLHEVITYIHPYIHTYVNNYVPVAPKTQAFHERFG